MATVSVLIPCWNARRYIARAVKSVIEQTMADWEIVIVSDDGSDYTEILKHHDITDHRIRHVYSPQVQSGVSAARNAGLRVASGNIVAVLDADDCFTPTRLETLLPLVERYGAAASASTLVEEKTGKALSCIWPVGIGAPVAFHDAQSFMTLWEPVVVMFQKEVRPQGWDARMRFAEDLVFNLELCESLGALPIVTERLYVYHIREDVLSAGPGAQERAVAAYQILLDDLAGGQPEGWKPQTRSALERLLCHRIQLNTYLEDLRQRGEVAHYYELLRQQPGLLTIGAFQQQEGAPWRRQP